MKNWYTIARTLAFLLTAVAVNAQSPPEIEQRISELHRTIRANELARAAEIAAALDEAVQQLYRTWLIRDAGQRVRDVLTWLPSDTESFFVLQEPFRISADDSPSLFYGRPGRRYATDRLIALGDGSTYRGFHGSTVRFVVAGMRNIQSTLSGVPARAPQADVAYFYFWTETIDWNLLGKPDDVSGKSPLWERKSRVHSQLAEPGGEPPEREESMWLAIPRPDLLVMATSREFLELLLKRMSPGTSRQALPDQLPEWREVNRAAPFWGLRHYTDPGTRKDDSNPKSKFSDPKDGDSGAIGVTFQFGAETDTIEARYLTTSDQLRGHLAHLLGPDEHDFEVDRLENGIWRLRSNTRNRGDYPFHSGMYWLGFGVH